MYLVPDDHLDGPLATAADAIREWVWNVGAKRPDTAWLCSHYDTWERNPHYVGPPVRHPDDNEPRPVRRYTIADKLPAACAKRPTPLPIVANRRRLRDIAAAKAKAASHERWESSMRDSEEEGIPF